MRFLSFFLLVACIGLNLHAADPAAAPDALVKELYKAEKQGNSPFFQDKDRKLLDHYFTKELGDLIWKDVIDSRGEVGTIDGDPLFDAQDTEIKDFVIHPSKTEDGKTTVLVTFLNFDKKTRIIYHFAQQGGVWKISDMQYADYELLRLLKENAGK